MIKLHFEPITFENKGIYCKGKVAVSLKYDNGLIRGKIFTTKITLRDNDVFDLNKAYKCIQTLLEKKAYNWAYNITNKERKNLLDFYNQMSEFTDKAKHIVEHDTEYLKTF